VHSISTAVLPCWLHSLPCASLSAVRHRVRPLNCLETHSLVTDSMYLLCIVGLQPIMWFREIGCVALHHVCDVVLLVAISLAPCVRHFLRAYDTGTDAHRKFPLRDVDSFQQPRLSLFLLAEPLHQYQLHQPD
jgi:hypothetical protein